MIPLLNMRRGRPERRLADEAATFGAVVSDQEHDAGSGELQRQPDPAQQCEVKGLVVQITASPVACRS
jgi:hypothetical protein